MNRLSKIKSHFSRSEIVNLRSGSNYAGLLDFFWLIENKKWRIISSDKLDVTDETKTQLESELKAALITIEELQTQLGAAKAGAISDVKALKESFESQKTQFKEKLDESTNQITQLEKQYALLEKQMKEETKERLEYEKLLEDEIKQKQQLEVVIIIWSSY